MITVLFGIQGVGKSAVTERIQEQMPIERIHWGRIAFDLAQKDNLIQNIDQLREQSIWAQKKYQTITAATIAQTLDRDRSKNYVIETHAALKTAQGYMPGMNETILRLLRPDLFVVVEAPADKVLLRRQKDPTRRRDHDRTIEEVQLNLDATRWFASVYAVVSGANILIVENKEGDLDFAASRIIEMIERFDKSAVTKVV